jgi:hypothetical protein
VPVKRRMAKSRRQLDEQLLEDLCSTVPERVSSTAMDIWVRMVAACGGIRRITSNPRSSPHC